AIRQLRTMERFKGLALKDRGDPKRAIPAGAGYLVWNSQMIEKILPELGDEEKRRFTLTAYNFGYDNLSRAVRAYVSNHHRHPSTVDELKEPVSMDEKMFPSALQYGWLYGKKGGRSAPRSAMDKEREVLGYAGNVYKYMATDPECRGTRL